MEIALTTNSSHPYRAFAFGSVSVLWKAWRESRGRFFPALVLLASLVVYAVVTSPGFLDRYNTRFPDKTLLYSVYVWTGLFHYALQGLWVLAAFVVALGGLAREKATGVALFTLGLPVGRLRLFLIRARRSDVILRRFTTAVILTETSTSPNSASRLTHLRCAMLGMRRPDPQSIGDSVRTCRF